MALEDSSGTAKTKSRKDLLRDPDYWPLFYETAKQMQTQQLLGVLERNIRHLVLPRLPVDFDAKYENHIPEDLPATPAPIRQNTTCLRNSLTDSRRAVYRQQLDEIRRGKLTFLHTTLDIVTDSGPAWFHPELSEIPALWALKFHGFEFLNRAILSADNPSKIQDVHTEFTRWIRHWAGSDETAIGREQYLRRAWTPHSVSLRVLNLSRYYGWCVQWESDTEFLRLLRRLIFKNARFLANHVEYDVGGNHLIENAVALVTAGVFFQNSETPWLSTGIDILEETSDQFLEDGGHFEHSPMYHIITLTRYLTVLSLLDESGHPWPEMLVQTARRATQFLHSIRPPDGRIPLLNDAVYGEALELETCLEYARNVDISLSQSTERETMAASGYFWIGDGEDRMLVDGGRFGPPHLPAHSHNDLFSILLWVGGRQLVTDTGTYHYAPSARRQYSRSVRGHNTVQVGDSEPITLGGQYLAGKRVRPEVDYTHTEDYTLFDGSYRRKQRPQYRHRRRIFGVNDGWLVQDTVTQPSQRPAYQRLNLHPDVGLGDHPNDDLGLSLQVDGEPAAYVLVEDPVSVTEETTPYFPEFCLERERSTLVFERAPDETGSFLLSTVPHSREEYRRLRTSLCADQTGVDDQISPVSQ